MTGLSTNSLSNGRAMRSLIADEIQAARGGGHGATRGAGLRVRYVLPSSTLLAVEIQLEKSSHAGSQGLHK